MSSLIFILVSVAFFTLYERKILGYSHARFGPNKVFFCGLFQPFSDALKLFMKLDVFISEVGKYFFFFAPILGIFLSLLLWVFIPFWGVLFYYKFSFLLLVLISGFGVYFLLYSGWCSVTKYSLLGSYRSSAQSVSYEVVMILLFLTVVYWWAFINLALGLSYNFLVGLFYLSMPVMFCWLLSCVAECNRSPFDFSEGESELVSGFNTEYGGGLFSIIFIGEYSSILMFSLLSSYLFFCSGLFYAFLIFSFGYLWVRSSFPRLRYDLLMMMAWKSLVVYSIGVFFLFICYM